LYETVRSTYVDEYARLFDRVKAWEKKHPDMARLDLEATRIRLHGVVIRTAADFAAMKKADGEVKLKEDQREVFAELMRRVKQRMDDRGAEIFETGRTTAEY